MKKNISSLKDPSEYKFCGSLNLVPENVSYLAKYQGQKVPNCEIGFKWNAGSQHVVIENFQPPSYYEDYLMTTSSSPSIQALQLSQVKKIITLFNPVDALPSMLEIGCGDGSFLRHASTLISRVVGVEPSRRFAAEAIQAGMNVIQGYVNSTTLLTDEKFDSFVSRQVFEHLPDPLDVLVGIRNMLNTGAVGLIEVPNGIRALRMKRFFEFFPDHVNYYSVNSLVTLASDAGFNVIGCQEIFGGDYLELLVRNDVDQESWFNEMIMNRSIVIDNINHEISKLDISGKKTAIFGCGAKTLCIIEASREEMKNKIACVIDSDPNKHGMFVPNSNIPIVSIDQANKLSLDVIVILALSYREEIASIIRTQLQNCKRIVTLDDFGKIIDL
jgi:Cyclopropane fatty acid synthase and related methyltransferases